MNELRNTFRENYKEIWTITCDIESLPSKGVTAYHGYVYVIEYEQGIKIGHTTDLRSRISQIYSNAKNYAGITIGRVAYTPPHTNHKENETLLHQQSNNKRKGKSELFNISFDEYFHVAPKLDYKDESEESEKKAAEFTSMMKRFILGGSF